MTLLWCRAWQAGRLLVRALRGCEGERLEISGRTVRADQTHPDPCSCRVRSVPRVPFPARACFPPAAQCLPFLHRAHK